MRIGIATDHGGFNLKEEVLKQLREAGHEVVDFGAHRLNQDDDYPDYVVPPRGSGSCSESRPRSGDLRERCGRVGVREQNPGRAGCVNSRPFFG